MCEALLAVAAAEGPARMTEVLRWALAPVHQRWITNPPTLNNAFDVSPVASAARWSVFHDVQLVERCCRCVVYTSPFHTYACFVFV